MTAKAIIYNRNMLIIQATGARAKHFTSVFDGPVQTKLECFPT